ncbi:hypothetical protein GGX14DRAFT_653064 [Mycena pura]|uniref:L domain-like protein n=1 Tax=Mycena pura TaxID=153505 RepID=A0AAD6YAS9_9AGAR|nr:hypothetical protein GGX14DRAFT_653064 [Mycena pura]
MSEDNSNRPAWQTDELQDEWVDIEPGDDTSDADGNNLTYGTRSISLTEPLPSHIHTNSDVDGDKSTSFHAVGTFLVREDIPNVSVLPKTPGRGRTGIIKDFFSPLPLERMFEPPSPPPPMPVPHVPATDASDEILETDMPNMVSFHGRKASLDCKFTFSAPRADTLNPHTAKPSFPLAQSTPTPPFASAPNKTAPPTDPRLRLFQFQYDTFTREHLSALADSIAVNTPSGTGSRSQSDARLTPVSEASFSDLRSTKRVKLSPPGDYGEGAGAGASIARPKIYGKAYVGESMSLMEKIKQARDFSTISTMASAHQSPGVSDGNDVNAFASDKSSAYERLRRSSLLNVPTSTERTASSSGGTLNSNGSGPYSSSTYRQQAAALMAQIKSDMKGNKRIFSGDSEMSHVTAHFDDEITHVAPLTTAIHDKENQREVTRHHHRRASSSGSARVRASPRPRTHRPLEPTAEAEGTLAADISKLSLARRRPSFLIPTHPVTIVVNSAFLGPTTAAHPTATLRSGTNEDLNRFVSSSTASGTTLTAGSVPAYVKHPGPAQLRTIAPQDMPMLPERMGDMMFDKVMMKWVRSVQAESAEEPSEDPFDDIESLRDDSRRGAGFEAVPAAEEAAEEAANGETETEDEEEAALTSFSTDASGRVVAVMTGIDSEDEYSTTDSEAANDAVVTGEVEHTVPRAQDFESESEQDDGGDTRQPAADHQSDSEITDAFMPPPIVVTRFTTPPPSAAKAPASAMKTALRTPGTTPASVLKDPSRARYRTPARRGHRRSVSFSDGKRDGPIRGLDSAHTMQPSARSKRIAEMLVRSDSSAEFDSDTPTKSGAPASGSGGSLASASASASASVSVASTSTPRRVFSRTNAQRNGTFLTECSFGVAHDRLVEVLTDVEPFEPHWETLSTVDLAGRRLESVARLKEFVPALDALNLNENQLAWLSGVPSGLRTLSVASNRLVLMSTSRLYVCWLGPSVRTQLTGLTSYSHLLNLENLDISRNEVDSLRQLACLRHLRELRADGNQLTNVEGLEGLDGLMKLSLAGNTLRELDLASLRWTRLEVLDVSKNRIRSVAGLAQLQALVVLNLDGNELAALDAGAPMPRLRVLRVSENRLAALRVEGLSGLRTLYVDGNALVGDELRTGGARTVVGRAAGREGRAGGVLAHLENLSVRNQRGGTPRLDVGPMRDAKRLYLSGNTLPTGFLSVACYNLVYLELARCGLTALPTGVAQLAPNLRALNLNYNFLEDVRGLEGLARLRKLSVVGARLKGTKALIRAVRGLPSVEVLDFRMNPCTLGWYLPLLVKGDEEQLSTAEWAELDARFRRSLPDAVYVGRLAYRGLVMGACGGVRVLDGVAVTEKERAKTQEVLRMMGR